MTELLLQRLEEIGRSLEQSGQALALIGLGSVGAELERLDQFSDLDFFAIVKDGTKKHFLEDLSWLSNIAPVVYAFQNTVDGFKVLYEDDVFCEFAVFELSELQEATFTAGRLIWKADGIEDSIATSNKPVQTHSSSPEHHLGEALTNLLIGLKRFRRGEKLIAARFVQQYALDRVIDLNRHLETAQNNLADPFSRERRLEQRYPKLALEMPKFMLGYERTPESALAILAWLEQRFSVSQAIAERIRQEVSYVSSHQNSAPDPASL